MRQAAGRFLERSLIFSWAIHAVAMLAMALFLVGGLPGGGHGVAERMAYVAAHPWLWRLGWIPWQLTALSDLLIAIALLRSSWAPRPAAWLGLLFTIAAILPEQTGELLFIWRVPAVAQSGDLAAYAALEGRLFLLTSAWGALAYAAAAVCWSWSFASAGIWRRWLTPFSAALWLFFAYISGGLFLPESLRPSASIVAGGNAAGFLLMMIWLTVITELVLRRSRPDGAHGRLLPWVYPTRNWFGSILNLLANSRLLRGLFEGLPVPPMLSDIRDVIYVNYLVPAARLEPLVPAGLELQRVGQGYALFTFLSFRHGHFGPRFLGPLRRLMPSPIQTNWRIYVRNPRTGQDGVYFTTNATDSLLIGLGARLFAEGMPMHVLRRAELYLSDGESHLRLDPGEGTAPSAEALLHPLGHAHPTDGPWRQAFASYQEMLAYCVPQDRALSAQPWIGRITRQEIDLGIPLDHCEPLEGIVRSPAAVAIVGDAEPFCFRVPTVRFRLEQEAHDRFLHPHRLA